jgi:hypothetical protein
MKLNTARLRVAAAGFAGSRMSAIPNHPTSMSGCTPTENVGVPGFQEGNTMPINKDSIKSDPTRLGGVPTPASVFPPRNATNPVGPPRPVPDGKLMLISTSGIEHVYQYKDMPHGWRPHSNYLAISTPLGRTFWPWHSIFRWETHANSPRYNELLQAWSDFHKRKTEEECDGVDSDRG